MSNNPWDALASALADLAQLDDTLCANKRNRPPNLKVLFWNETSNIGKTGHVNLSLITPENQLENKECNIRGKKWIHQPSLN